MRRSVPLMIVLAMLAPGPLSAQPPDINVRAESAALMDATTGKILYAKGENIKRPPASLTKIMTLVVAFEALKSGRVKLTDMAVASEEAEKLGGTQVFAAPGEVFPFGDWVTAVAVGSANDASVVVAEHIAGSEKRFVQMMNEKAKALGMTDSNFMNCHGLDDEGHYTTAKDMAVLSRYATTFPDLLKLTGTYEATFRKGKFQLWNINKQVLFYPGCDGLKTGSTGKAKYCVSLTAKRGNSRFVSVVLGAENSDIRFADGRRLLDYGFANYSSVMLASKGESFGQVRVHGGSRESVDAIVEMEAGLTLPKGEDSGIAKQVALRTDMVAPVRKGDKVGDLVVTRAGKEIDRIPLVAREDVRKAPFWIFVPRVFMEITRLRW